MQDFKDTIYHGFKGIKHKADRTYRMTSEKESTAPSVATRIRLTLTEQFAVDALEFIKTSYLW